MKIDKLGNLLHWEDMRETLREGLKGLSFQETLRQWDEWDRLFRELENGALYPDWLRSMILVDRYFLLTQVILPDKVRPLALHPWLFDRCREVEAEPDGYLDLWAREHWKTSIITHTGCIQEILTNPEITIGIFSHTKGIAKKILMSIKNDLENNGILKDCFPDILYQNPKKDSPLWTLEKFTVKRSTNTREATCEAWGVVDGQPTGAHFLLRVYDDLVTAESVNTPEQIEKTTEMLALSDNLGSAGGRVRFIGTRYSLGDTYQHMMEKGQVKVRLFPATHNGTIDGDPVFFSREYWESKKSSQTVSTLSCQMLQNPNAGSQAMFKIENLMVYLKRPALLNVYILVDPANSKKKGSDLTAMCVIGVDSSYHKYLLDGVHHRMGLAEKWDALKTLHKKWSSMDGVQNVFVGYEKYGMQSDIEYFQEQMAKTQNEFEIIEVGGKTSKLERMARLEPDIRNRRFWVPCMVTEDAKYKTILIDRDPNNQAPRIQKKVLNAEALERNRQMLSDKLAVRPIRGKNENGKVYDLTLDFIYQAMDCPNNSAHDDLVDAASRIYDLEIMPPRVYKNSGSYQPEFIP